MNHLVKLGHRDIAYTLGQKTAELLRTRQQNPELPPQEWIVDYRLEVRETTARRIST